MSNKKSVVNIDILDCEKRVDPVKFYVYIILIKWSDYSVSLIFRRYNDFQALHESLTNRLMKEKGFSATHEYLQSLKLPGKVYGIQVRNRRIAEDRIIPLDTYLRSLLALPSEISQLADITTFLATSSRDLAIMADLKVDSSAVSSKGGTVSSPKAMAEYYVMKEFKKKTDDQISAKEGDHVKVIKKTSTGWWKVHHNTETGWFPGNFLRPLEEDNPNDEVYDTPSSKEGIWFLLKAFQDEKQGIQLGEGCLVNVVSASLTGWWSVQPSLHETMQIPASLLRPLRPQMQALIFVGQED